MYNKAITIIVFSFFMINLVAINTQSSNVIKNQFGTKLEMDLLDNQNFNRNLNELSHQTTQVFTENRGQLKNDEIRFYEQSGSFWFTDDGVWMELREEISDVTRESGFGIGDLRLSTDDYRLTTRDYKRVILKQEFIDANSVQPYGLKIAPHYYNFFYGNDSTRWRSFVPNYHEIYYENIYDGIDLNYFQFQDDLKYDLIVEPGADPNRIKIKYSGAEGLEIDEDGNLVIKTLYGQVLENAPIIYQEDSSTKQYIDGNFVLLNDLEYGFEITSEYDSTRPLVIDPKLELEYSTYIGNNGNEEGNDIAVDDSGCAYVTGFTNSNNFPTTPGAYDTSVNWTYNVIVSKFNPSGSKLVYSTYVAGDDGDVGLAIDVDKAGNAYVGGSTNSADFPTTPGANDTQMNYTQDSFVFKLNSTGSGLIYSTYVGGNLVDTIKALCVDSQGFVYITGEIGSKDYYTSPNAYQKDFNNDFEVFVSKLNISGDKMIYSTFVGGDNRDHGLDITIDSVGNAFVTGKTRSDFPTTIGAYDRTNNGSFDSFVFKLNHNGSALIYSTMIGGPQIDEGRAITLDSNGIAIVTGMTTSPSFPTTPGAYRRINNGSIGNVDIFITKINETGGNLSFSTFIGGSGHDYPIDIITDDNDDIVVSGTVSPDFPITPDAFFSTYNGCVFFKMAKNGSELLYSTFFGGTGLTYINGIDIDVLGDIYLAGTTSGSDFPNTTGAYDQTHNGANDIFVSKFSLGTRLNISSVEILQNNTQINTAYANLMPYNIKVNVSNTISLLDVTGVNIILDPGGANIILKWDSINDQIEKFNDPNDNVTLEPSSNAYNNSLDNWTIDFNITFNWTFPTDDPVNVHTRVSSIILGDKWLNKTGLFSVETDIILTGILSVLGEDERAINNNGLVRGGEILNFSGLIPVYENSIDIYPPAVEFDISVWDEFNQSWLVDPVEGEPFQVNVKTPINTDTDGFNYTINLTGIPICSDETENSFTVKIDGDNVTYSKSTPANTTWHNTLQPTVGITISDSGGGLVNSSSIKHSVSTDDGDTWGPWVGVTGFPSEVSVDVFDEVTLADGFGNLVKWQAKDSMENGPGESEPYHVLVDTENLWFTNHVPEETEESTSKTVHVGIDVSDNISGVNASTIRYSVSFDSGQSWGTWKMISGLDNNNTVQVRVNITFPNGTGNHIRWRAYDLAGNGPIISKTYNVIVNTWLEQFQSKVTLKAPVNNSIIAATSIDLVWQLETYEIPNITYDVFLDTVNPPVKLEKDDHDGTKLIVTGLENLKTYYWTVIPENETLKGKCLSGVWSFSVNISIPVPSVSLIKPENGAVLDSVRPILSWETLYEGINKVTYDIHIKPVSDPENVIRGHPNEFYYPNYDFKKGETYYWRVVPYAGSVIGIESNTWSFRIKEIELKPDIDLAITINRTELELKPGEDSNVKATVENKGDVTDTISMKLQVPEGKGVTAVIKDSNSAVLVPNNSAEFIINILVEPGAEEGEIDIVIIASSNIAKEHNLSIERNVTLTVKKIIDGADGDGGKDDGKDDGKDKTTEGFGLFEIAIIAFIIIVVFLIIIFLILTKKRKGKETEILDESQQESIASFEPDSNVSPQSMEEQQPVVSELESQDIQHSQPLPTTQELEGTPDIETNIVEQQVIPQMDSESETTVQTNEILIKPIIDPTMAEPEATSPPPQVPLPPQTVSEATQMETEKTPEIYNGTTTPAQETQQAPQPQQQVQTQVQTQPQIPIKPSKP